MRIIGVARLAVAAVALFCGMPASALAQAAAARRASDALSAFAVAKAERLLRDRLPCLGCHELGGEGGRIGPSLSNVGARRSRDDIAAMIGDPQRTVPNTIMPKAPMNAATAALVADYLSRRARSREPPPFAPPPAYGTPSGAPPDDPATVYRRFCAPCHGLTGDGDGYNAPFLSVRSTAHASAAYMSTRSDDALYDAIAGGGYIMNRSARMPPYGGTLSAAQIRGLVAYLRTLCRCNGPAWSRDNW